MSYTRFTAGAVVEVEDFKGLMEQYRRLKSDAPHLWTMLVDKFVVRKPLTKKQVNRLPRDVFFRLAPETK